jgi:hypothetical protein
MKVEHAGYNAAGGCLSKRRVFLAGQFAAVKYRSETYCWTKKLNRVDYGVDKYWVTFFFSRLRFEISRLRLRFLAD